MPEPLCFPLRHGPPRHDPAGGAWTLTRHADVAALLASPVARMRDPAAAIARLAEAAAVDAAPLLRLIRSWAVFLDPPEHAPARGWLVAALRLIAPAFAPDAVEAAVADLIGVRARKLDVGAITGALPAVLLARGLGVEPLRVTAIAEVGARLSMAWHAPPTLADTRSAALDAAALEAAANALLVEGRRGPCTLDAPSGMDRRHALAFLIIAATETTATLAANALALCLLDPAARAAAAARRLPADVIRRAGPFRLANARLAAPLEGALAAIPPDAVVLLDLAQANHDPAVFPQPFAIAADRPPRSLAFGLGAHACIGAAVARDVLGAFLATVCARHPRLAGTGPTWAAHPWLHRVANYAVAVEGEARCTRRAGAKTVQ